MKDATTDHKAHVRCLQDFAAAYDAESENGRALRAAIEALTAAPAASEGEDGAVFVRIERDDEYADVHPELLADDFVRNAGSGFSWSVHTRPAAQVAATPKHDEGRGGPSYAALLIIVQSVCGALERAGITDCDDPGEAIDVMREQYERRIHKLTADPDDALATQPAARRVTDGVWVEPVVVPGSPHAHIVRFRCGQQRFDIGDALDTMEEAKAFAAMFRHALESFAQPAEGVSE